MRLSPTKFNSFLGFIGQTFLWRRAYACPCITEHSGAARPDCPLCTGRGRIYAAAVSGKAGFTNQGVKRKFAEFGIFEPGDAMMTIQSDSPLYAMGQFDRVLMQNSTSPFSHSLKRGSGDKLYGTIATVDRVFWLNDAGDTIVEGGIPTVAANGTLTWVTGEPPAGKTYSITGTARDEYFCYLDLPSDRSNHSGAALPRKVMLRRFDLFGR